MAEIDKTAVANALGEPLGDAVLDGRASLEAVDVLGVDTTIVWRVRDELADHPWQAYVGRWPDGQVRMLTADQEAWAQLVQAVGAHLTDAEQAREYVEAFLEVTRGAMVLVQPVTSLDDLRWRPGSDSEEAAKAALLASPPDLAPVATRSGDGFHVELALVVDQRLQRNSFDVSTSGDITNASFDVLADGLPLPFIR
jgi:hypothetical protein